MNCYELERWRWKLILKVKLFESVLQCFLNRQFTSNESKQVNKKCWAQNVWIIVHRTSCQQRFVLCFNCKFCLLFYCFCSKALFKLIFDWILIAFRCMSNQINCSRGWKHDSNKSSSKWYYSSSASASWRWRRHLMVILLYLQQQEVTEPSDNIVYRIYFSLEH